jgi:hypothetical protein
MRALPYLLAVGCAIALNAEATKTANAITITETINFTATGFGTGAPVNPVIGSFTITFDPMVTVVGRASARWNARCRPLENVTHIVRRTRQEQILRMGGRMTLRMKTR